MTRSPSVEHSQSQTQQPKQSKRKGTRSVSTLTPSQLARKRANDREAQRAIRARTKEHIERLERELEDLKSRHSRDETVQELMRKNKALERELMALRESLGIHGRPYPHPAYEDGLSSHGSGMSSRPPSFGQGSSEYNSPSSFGGSYLPTPEPCELWSSVVSVSAVSVPSVVSSPSSSAGNTDDYVPGYIPTSVPSTIVDGAVLPSSSICMDSKPIDYEDMDTGELTRPASQPIMHRQKHGAYSHHSSVSQTPSNYIHHPPSWPVYQASYYPPSPAI